MASTELQIANAALTKMGEPLLTQAQLTAATPRPADIIDQRIDDVTEEVLRMYLWKSATEKARVESDVQTVTAGDDAVFTLTFNGQTTGNITKATADGAAVETALEALSTIAAGEATTTGVAGGPWTVTFSGDLDKTVLPLTSSDATTALSFVTRSVTTGYRYGYLLPANTVRVERPIDLSARWERRKGRIWTDDQSMEFRYVERALNTDGTNDYSGYDALLNSAIASWLALELSIALKRDNRSLSQLRDRWDEVIDQATHVDSIEQSNENLLGPDFVRSRLFNPSTGPNFQYHEHG